MRESSTGHGAAGASHHYYVIDLARGLAAIAILFWHYQHFFYLRPGQQVVSAGVKASQPFFAALWPLYDYGFYAVQFFWLISGFVFAAVYIGRATTTRAFVSNRLARLYPFHLLTLLIVAALQILSVAVLGRTQIYLNNDLYHFALNLVLASGWGLERGQSFNDPIWSVSVEVLIYAAFWITLSRLYRRGILGPAVLALACYLLAGPLNAPLPRVFLCGFYFFTGTTIFLLFQRFRDLRWMMLATSVAAIGAGVAINLVSPKHLASLTMPCVLIGLMIACCWLESLGVGRKARRVQWIGDNTYGIYLSHIPIQIAALIVLDVAVGSRAVATEPWFLLAFLTVVMIVARLAFVYVERPARFALRRLLA